ncbi:MAG: RNA polymerase sigma factor [Candidatus Aminicenantes bacterium]|nr:RNA polymerase sigma factor [Candidatus Aminicenantes bacterium]
MCKDNRMDDTELLKSCLKGNVEDFKKVMERYAGKAIAMAWNVLGNKQDAEDICQEVFFQAYHRLDTFDFNRKFKDWFYTILFNRCKDHLRKRRRFQKYVSRKKREESGSIEKAGVDALSSGTVPEAVLEKLTPKERLALYLWAVEEYTSAEIGAILKCSPSTARVHLFKARRRLKPLLEERDVNL